MSSSEREPATERLRAHASSNAAMFARIARRYDVANDVLSLGVHRHWRKALLDAVDVKSGDRVLDVATGTGEVAIALADRGGDVVGVDVCEPMLVQAREKGAKVRFDVGDAMALPFADASFDVVTIAWGIRNVADPAKGVQEMARVLKPGGRLGILEFGQPDGLFGAAYDVYGQKILPRIGGLVAGDSEAYAYLNRSSSKFPCGEDFARLVRPHVASVDVRRFFGGLAWLYCARR